MRATLVRLLAPAIAGMSLLLAGTAVAQQELKIGGTGNALGTMRLLGDAYSRHNPAMKVTILPSLGSSGAIKAIPRGAIDIGVISRPLTEEERGLGSVATEYARTPLVFAVASNSKVRAINLRQVADIYSGMMASWPDGSQIRPVLRQAGDDNTRQLRQMSPDIDKALTAAEARPGMPFATTDQETADKTEAIPGAFSITTLSLINSERRSLRPLALEGIEPTAGNGASGKYPHAKPFFIVTRTDPPPEVKRFIAYLHSPAGRDILIRTGHWIP